MHKFKPDKIPVQGAFVLFGFVLLLVLRGKKNIKLLVREGDLGVVEKKKSITKYFI